MTTSNMLTGIGFEMHDEWLGAINRWLHANDYGHWRYWPNNCIRKNCIEIAGHKLTHDAFIAKKGNKNAQANSNKNKRNKNQKNAIHANLHFTWTTNAQNGHQHQRKKRVKIRSIQSLLVISDYLVCVKRTNGSSTVGQALTCHHTACTFFSPEKYDLILNRNEIALLGGVNELLDIFNVFTTFIQGNEYPTMNTFVLFYAEIEDRLKKIIAHSEDEVITRADKFAKKIVLVKWIYRSGSDLLTHATLTYHSRLWIINAPLVISQSWMILHIVFVSIQW